MSKIKEEYLLVESKFVSSLRYTRDSQKLQVFYKSNSIYEYSDVEVTFEMCAPFTSKQHLKRWVMQEQPYYKKHIPEVYQYFLNKSGL
jgi:hypothetical protein